MLRRLFDVLLAFVGIAVVLPFFPLVLLLIKWDSKGPVFYLCDRIGKGGEPFKMYKLRTMYDTLDQSGLSISPQGDPRVTRLGRFLRRTKFNEFPQLINILKGDMTFVGPRPEAPDLAVLYPACARAIFTIKPGLVGPNQILGRNEEEWYPPGVDPQRFYIDTILPKKLPLDLEYVRHSSAFVDLKYILLGVKETIFRAVNWNLVLQNRSQIYLLVVDFFLCLASFVLAHFLRFAGLPLGIDATFLLQLLPAVVLVRIPCFVYCGLYGTLIRYLSLHDFTSVLKGVSVGSLLLVSLTFLSDFRSVSRTVFFIDWLCLIFLMSSLRCALRFFWDRHSKSQARQERRVLIFGAGDAGVLAYRYLMADKENAFAVVGFLDDDPAKRHKTLYGKKVLGNRYTIEAVVKLYQVHEVLLAIPSAPLHEIDQVIHTCRQVGIHYRVFPTLKDASHHVSLSARETSLAELLETQDVRMNTDAVRSLLQGKSVLITGACGALGLELCRQILRFSPHKLVIIDRYESYLTELVSRLVNTSAAELVIPVLFSPASNGSSIANVFLEHQPHIVFHTATRKYTSFFDLKAEDVVRANYLSTFALARQAVNGGCEYFVMLSSEEAANRGNPVSDSLRAAEISLRQFFADHRTKLVIARLCDILENRGGTISVLREQIAHHETVTLPHPNATCHFLSKRAATHFILETLVLANAGLPVEGIFVCDYGEPIPLMEIVSKLTTLNGWQRESDLPIKFLNRHTQTDDNPAVRISPNASEQLLPIGHTHIRLLRDALLPNSPEVSTAIHHILHLQEHDLGRAAWEEHTHNLLRLASVS